MIAASCHQHGLAVGEARLGTVEATVLASPVEEHLVLDDGLETLSLHPDLESVLVADQAVVVDPRTGRSLRP